MLKILGVGAFCVIFVVMLIVSIAHSVLLFGFLLAIFVIALILRPLLFVGASFASLGNEKRFNAVMEKHVPLVSRREQYLKSYMLNNSNLDYQINQNINTININNIENMIINDNDLQFSTYMKNTKLSAELIKSFYFNKDEYISTNNLLEPFSKAIVGLIAFHLILAFVDLKNTLHDSDLNEDDDEYLVATLLRDFIIATNDSLIITMVKELTHSIIINIDHVTLFKDVMFTLKSYSKNNISSDFYRNRIIEISDDFDNLGRSLVPTAKASFIHYYQFLLENCDCISEDISIDQKISLAQNFIKQDREIKQIADLFNKVWFNYIEASAIAISLAKH